MLRWYGYLGIALIIFAEINFWAVIQPFATWYIPIVWYGYILFVDSLVYKIKGRSFISSHFKEFIFLCLISIPFWSIFEFYNLYTLSWGYTNYVWYLHLVDFTTIMPAILETFSLLNVLKIGEWFDTKRKIPPRKISYRDQTFYNNVIKLLVVVGAFTTIIPILIPSIGFPFMWLGLYFFLEPLNYLTGRASILQKISIGKKSTVLRLWLAGIIMGFFWEFWNYQAYPKWSYTLPSAYLPTIKIFAMPLAGYLGYLPFAVEVFVFFAAFRPFLFKDKNDLISM
jgi:hypothetical protein